MSVIIPTLNAGPQFRELLIKLREQSCPLHEIIVIDSESTDGTPEIALENGAKLLTVKRSEFDHGGTRNRAAEASEGNILMFMTQDAMPENANLIAELTSPLAAALLFPMPLAETQGRGDQGGAVEGDIVASYARQLPAASATPIEQLARLSNYPSESHLRSYSDVNQLGLKAFFCSNVCSAIIKDVFFRMGKFQEPVIFNEDLFMSAKCILNGYKVAYCSEAKVTHSHNYSIKQQFKRFFDNGISLSLNPALNPYRSIGGAGTKLVVDQVKGLIRKNASLHIPRLLLESAAKLLGFKLGLHHQKLPSAWVGRFSMHAGIWTYLTASGKSAGEGQDSSSSNSTHGA
ncbi:glycosyltransferase family 2 protein [Paenibacillus sp. CAU 1782]